jgi:methyl-accepting chemotaxis protein
MAISDFLVRRSKIIIRVLLLILCLVMAALLIAARLLGPGWITALSAAGAILAAVLFLLWQGWEKPADNWVRAARVISRRDIRPLVAAVGEISQGNLSVRLDARAEPLRLSGAGGLSAFNAALNDIAEGVRSATIEFNKLTDVPCRRLCYVGADSFLEGRLAGEIMADLIPEKGQVVVSTALLNHAGLELRRKGFTSRLNEKRPDISLVGVVENKGYDETAYRETRELLKKYPRLSGIYITNAAAPPSVARAIEDAGMRDSVKIVSHDLIDATMKCLQKGLISATIDQNPFAQGHDPLIHLYNHLVGGWRPQSPRLLTPMKVVDQSNWRQYWDPESGLLFPPELVSRLVQPTERVPEKPLRFVVLSLDYSAFWTTVEQGVRKAERVLESRGVTVEWRVPDLAKRRVDYGAAAFTPEIEACIAGKVDGLAVYCGDEALVPVINRAVDAGVPVVTFNSEPFNLRSLLSTIQGQARTLMDMSQGLSTSAMEVSAATAEVTASIENISTGIVTQNEEFRTTEGAVESLLDHIGRIHQEAGRSAESADRTAQAVQSSNEAMNRSIADIQSIVAGAEETWSTVQSLSRASERVDAVVRMINEIAMQVNILALNAQIEATRAGEYGAGFMVVADEIRNLAGRSSTATAEIGQIIKDMKKGVSNVRGTLADEMERMRTAKTVTDEARTTLSAILAALNENGERMQRIAESITRVRDSSDQVSASIRNLAQVSTANAQSIQEVSVAAETLSVQYEDVAALAGGLERMSRTEQEQLAKFMLGEKGN